MPTTREQLINDWQEQLAAASELPSESAPRAAWLARLRIRLYRFLISLYGDGRWNASATEEKPSPAAAAFVLDDADALPLTGKPAKDGAQIRSVLKTVATAQDSRPARGPWTQGLADGKWLVVACQKDGLDMELCARLLAAYGIVCRIASESQVLIVPEPLARSASGRIAENRLSLRPAPVRVISKVTPAGLRWMLFLTIAPLVVVASAAIAVIAYSDDVYHQDEWIKLAQTLAVLTALSAFFFVRPIGQFVQLVDRTLTKAICAIFKRRSPKEPH